MCLGNFNVKKIIHGGTNEAGGRYTGLATLTFFVLGIYVWNLEFFLQIQGQNTTVGTTVGTKVKSLLVLLS